MSPIDKKIKDLLKKLPEEMPGKDFDRRFWERFEAEKDLPLEPTAPFAGVTVKVGVACAATLVGIALLCAALRPERATIAIWQGGATLSANGIVNKAPLGKSLKTGDRLRTNESGWAVVECPEGYKIKVHPNSELLVKELKSGLVPKSAFYLSRGEVLVSIGGRTHRKYPLEIHTPNAFARAMGTQFAVSASAASPLSHVSVLNGEVKVGSFIQKKGSAPVSVFAGQETTVRNAESPSDPKAILADARRELEELFQFGKEDQAILLVSMSPGRTRELLAPCAIYMRFKTDDREAERLSALVRGIQKAAGEDDAARHLETARELESLIREETKISPVPVLLFVGAYYEYLGQHEEAIRVLDDTALFYPKSNLRSMALLAKAIIYEEKLNLPAKAIKAAREILKDYPKSYETTEAASIVKRLEAVS